MLALSGLFLHMLNKKEQDRLPVLVIDTFDVTRDCSQSLCFSTVYSYNPFERIRVVLHLKMSSKKLKYVVVDSAAFMKNVPVWEHGDELFSVEGVLAEIKDRETQQYVASFPVNVNFKEPHPDSYKFIEKFTKKSGDYHDLSVVDLKLLALTYELETTANGTSHLRTEPMKKITNTTVTVPAAQLEKQAKVSLDAVLEELEDESVNNSRAEGVDGSESMETGGQSQMKEQSNVCADNQGDEDDGDQNWNVISRRGKKRFNLNASLREEDGESVTSSVRKRQASDGWVNDKLPGFYRPPDDPTEAEEADDEGWLTPDNIAELGECDDEDIACEGEPGEEDGSERPSVAAACITADFTMQNVLKHIGLAVLGVDGRLIREIRTFVLRCFACYSITSDRSKVFCPRCGHRTLKRVSTTINPDGTQQIWISRRPLNTRGMRYNLPKPRGGQHAVQPLLTADQRFPFQWAKKSKKVNALSEDFVAGSSPFSTRDVYSRAAQHGYANTERGIKGQLKYAKIWKPKRGRTVKK